MQYSKPYFLRTLISNPIDHGIFEVFLNYGGGGRGDISQLWGIFILYFRKQDYDYLIDLKFGTNNYWGKTIKNAKF